MTDKDRHGRRDAGGGPDERVGPGGRGSGPRPAADFEAESAAEAKGRPAPGSEPGLGSEPEPRSGTGSRPDPELDRGRVGDPDGPVAAPPGAVGPAGDRGEDVDWRAKARENYDLFLRARADYENLVRRTQREVSVLVRLGKKDMLLKLLDLADNLERAAAAWRETLRDCAGVDGDALVDGVLMIGRQLGQVLASEGVRPIEAVGCAFDPTLHECVATWQSPDDEAETVTDEIRKGYTFDGEVLRAAQVRVAQPEGE